MFEKLCALKNKKGFTLIEMLVVIAIIAVLVAVAIPVVGSSTDKASAATNAANLRALVAEANTLYLTETPDSTSHKITGANVEITFESDNATIATVAPTSTAPKSKKVGGLTSGNAAIMDYDPTTGFTATFGVGNTIDAFSKVADGTAEASSIVAYRAE